MPQIIGTVFEEVALSQLESYSCLTQETQEYVKMSRLLLPRAEKDNHVFQVDEARLPTDSCKNHIQSSLEGRRCVLQAERQSVKPKSPCGT